MSFRAANQKYLIPIAQWLMVLGIIALCQPWNSLMHRYGLTVILIGLVAFLITTHISAPEVTDEDEEAT
jgi:hypothetical protein